MKSRIVNVCKPTFYVKSPIVKVCKGTFGVKSPIVEVCKPTFGVKSPIVKVCKAIRKHKTTNFLFHLKIYHIPLLIVPQLR